MGLGCALLGPLYTLSTHPPLPPQPLSAPPSLLPYRPASPSLPPAGLARLAATSAADYQHHASEYGVHWNFFLTLAALRLLGLAAPWAARSCWSAGTAGTALLAAYQCWLSAWGGIQLVHSDERGASLISANKEGLASLAGYWALQLLATAAGHAAYHAAAAAAAAAAVGVRRSSRLGGANSAGSSGSLGNGDGGSLGNGSGSRGSLGNGGSSSSGFSAGLTIRTKVAAVLPAQLRASQARLLAQLALGSATLWAAYWAAATHLQPVSRRACNAAYVLWMLALNAQCVTLFVGADVLLPGVQPHLLTAVNACMLPFFLAANLLTGLVNLSMHTLTAPDSTAVAVLAAYTALLGAAAVALHDRRQR